jgi:hypothetical protein
MTAISAIGVYMVLHWLVALEASSGRLLRC